MDQEGEKGAFSRDAEQAHLGKGPGTQEVCFSVNLPRTSASSDLPDGHVQRDLPQHAGKRHAWVTHMDGRIAGGWRNCGVAPLGTEDEWQRKERSHNATERSATR